MIRCFGWPSYDPFGWVPYGAFGWTHRDSFSFLECIRIVWCSHRTAKKWDRNGSDELRSLIKTLGCLKFKYHSFRLPSLISRSHVCGSPSPCFTASTYSSYLSLFCKPPKGSVFGTRLSPHTVDECRSNVVPYGRV